MSEIKMKISIPADNDGFVLFQCPICGVHFKLRPSDFEDDSIISIKCPSCGLLSENYFTDDVIQLALDMSENAAMDILYNEMKEWERQFNGNGFSFKAGDKPKEKLENPIVALVEALSVKNYSCCHKEAKIKPILKMCGSYCPFCGVKDYENE